MAHPGRRDDGSPASAVQATQEADLSGKAIGRCGACWGDIWTPEKYCWHLDRERDWRRLGSLGCSINISSQLNAATALKSGLAFGLDVNNGLVALSCGVPAAPAVTITGVTNQAGVGVTLT